MAVLLFTAILMLLHTTVDAVNVSPTNPVVFEGQDINITCSSTESIQWFRNDVLLPQTTMILELTNVSLAWDQSIITCTTIGSNHSAVLTVYSAAPVFIEHPQNVTVTQGSSFTLGCTVRGFPQPLVVWYRNGSPFFLMQPDPFNNLNFNSATDEYAGEYRCRATSNAVENPVFSNPATVIVTFPPEFTVQPESSSVLNNTRAALNCSAKGNPPPTISWTHNGEPVIEDDRVSILDNGTLIIESVDMIHMGVYRCVASNSLGSDESDDALLMIDLFPLFRRTPERTSAGVGEPVTLNCTAIGIPTPDFSWTKDDEPLTVDDLRTIVENGSLVFDSVSREDAGLYVCIASNIYGEIRSEPPAELIVTGPPLPPTVTVFDVGATWGVLSLTPHPDSNPPVSSYTIQYKLSFQTVYTQTTTNTQSLNITELYPRADYSIQVTAMNPVGSSPAANVSLTTPTGLPVGDTTAEDVQIVHVNYTAVQVHVTVPEVLMETSFQSISATLMNSGESIASVMATSSPLLLTELEPATQYMVEVVLVFEGGFEGQPTQYLFTTEDGIPSAPVDLLVTSPTPNSLQVTWSSPDMPAGTIIAYTVLLDQGLEEMNTSDTMAVFNDLDAFTNYSVSVSASTVTGEGPEAQATAQTAQDVPEPPNNLSLDYKNSTTVALSWDALTGAPGVLVGYWVASDSGHNISVEGINLLISGLSPYILYEFRVAGATEAGVGSYGQPLQVTTLSDVPTAVPMVTVTVVCPSDLVISWTVDGEGINGPSPQLELLINNTTRLLEYSESGNSSEAVMAYTNYTIALAVSNVNGTGGFSPEITRQSCDAFAGPPNMVVIGDVNSTAISLSWQPLGRINGTLLYYLVLYADAESAIPVPPERTGFVLTDLRPYTMYNISVASVTGAGRGELSEPQEVRTLADVPTAVPVVTVSAACPSDLVISWTVDDEGINGPSPELTLQLNNNVYNGPFTYDNSGSGSFRVSDRDLNTVYTVAVAVTNSEGTGPFSSAVEVTTLAEGLATPPLNVQASPGSSSSIEVSWDPPSEPNGFTEYILSYEGPNTAGNVTIDNVVTEYEITELSVYSEYEITVSANSLCGVASAEPVSEFTGQEPPSEVRGLRNTSQLPSAIVVEWEQPELLNGAPIEYHVVCGSPPAAVVEELRYECTGLVPSTEYIVSVSASNGAGRGAALDINTKTACPDLEYDLGLIEDAKIQITRKPNQPDRTDCTIASVNYVLVVVQELPTAATGRPATPSRALEDYTLPELLEATRRYVTARQRRQVDRESVYITANVTEDRLSTALVVGDDQDYNGFTNYPLLSGVFYNVGLRGVVPGAESGTLSMAGLAMPITAAPPTTAEFPLLIVAVSAGAGALLIFAILLVICCLCVCCYCNRRSKYTLSHHSTIGRLERNSSMRLSSKRKAVDPVEDFRANHRTEALEDYLPVPVSGFINKLLVMKANDNQLFFQEFGAISMTPQSCTEVADSAPNKRKNRYNNILPYDNNRVRVKGNSDYINASYCSGYMKNKMYIATQGPVPETVGDFWRMVWDENVRTVVMLTNTSEKGKVKCETYWPREVGCSTVNGSMEIILDSSTALADFTIRTFSLHKSGSNKEGRIVRQFHFTSWPDHGVPQYATAMLSMLRRVRAYHTKLSSTGPMLVHCSAGVGRTGTFIVIDSMLEKLKNGEQWLDIFGHVSLLRTQRNYMVQTEEQYFFIHDAIAEALLCGNTEVTLEGLGAYVSDLNNSLPEDPDCTHIEVQFKRLAVDKNDPYGSRYVTANKDCNKIKNRLVNILPYENNRVCLEFMRGVDGSDYINASHIDSYHNRRAFIATQGPLANTTGDFWRMVWQYTSPVIVMLTELEEKGQERCARYWPEQVLGSEQHDKFIVELAVERHSEHYTFRDINLTNSETGAKRTVSHFQFHGWPEVGTPGTPSLLLDFIREVQKMYSILRTKAPITVHCGSGVGRSGVFITLHITLERMVSERLVDIFQTVKNLRIQRPAMVQTLGQYHFCYESTLHYLESSDLLMSRASSLSRKRSLKATPPSSQASPTKSAGPTLSRNDSVRTPTRALESTPSGAHIYGGSEATSTFGSHPSPVGSNPALTLSSSQLIPPPNGTLSGASSQIRLEQYGGSQSHLNARAHPAAHMRNASIGHVSHQLAESQRYSTCSNTQ